MFPCKVKLESLDIKNTKVKDVEFKTNKTLTKSKIKKLVTQEKEKTSFYYLGNYFQEKGKSIGDFLSLGKSLKLEKHFVQNEMKASKNSLMESLQDYKNAATGEIYVDEIEEITTICFEPHEKCKIPITKWPKILKKLKNHFSGIKAVVIINGEILEAEKEVEEGPETPSQGSVPEEKIEKGTSRLPIDAREVIQEYKSIQNTYDIVKSKEMHEKCHRWMIEFETLSKENQRLLLKEIEQVKKVHALTNQVIQTDNKIEMHIAQIFAGIRKYLQLKREPSSNSSKLAQKLNTAIDQIKPLIQKVKDEDFLKACEDIQRLMV